MTSKLTDAPEQIFASPDRDDGWRWPRASKFPEQGPYENVSYTRSDLTPDPADIREAALREALSAVYHHAQDCLDDGRFSAQVHVLETAEEILALIGEKK